MSSRPSVYSVSIDYSLSLDQMIAAGHYGYIGDRNKADLKHFPINGQGIITCELKLESYEDAVSREGATIEQVLAFGAKYPDIQRDGPITALGSIWHYPLSRGVVCLDWDGMMRTLGIMWIASAGLGKRFRLLVRR